MKKFVSICLILLIISAAIPFTASAAISDFEFVITGASFDGPWSAHITAYHGSDTTVVIPENYYGYPVTLIEDSVFENNKNIKKVIIGEGIESIGYYTFAGCSNLKSVSLPSTLEGIYVRAFENCTSLESLTLPKSLSYLDSTAFAGCTGLREIKVNGNNPNFTAVNNILFSKNKSQLLIYPAGKSGAYTIPDSVSEIGSFAFFGRSELTKITIPDSVKIIGEEAFAGCTGLKTVTIPGCKTIYWRAFFGCTGLKSAIIEEGTTEIYDRLFDGCTSLKTIELPASLQQNDIERYLNGSANLTELIVAEDNPVYCTVDGVLYNKEKTNLLFCPPGISGEFAIPEGTTSCSYGAFYECKKITGLYFPASLESVGSFNDLTSLKAVTVSEDNENFASVDGFLCNKNKTEIILCPKGKSGIVKIPDGIDSVDYFGFLNCSEIRSIEFPESFTKLDFNKFAGCTLLSTIVVPDTVRSFSGDGEYLIARLTLIGSSGSYAQEYALKNDISFIDRDSIMTGDVNNDGEINSMDATLDLQCAAGIISDSVFIIYAADVTGDGVVSSVDATKILQLRAGIIESF